jgi:hypothetical protein
VDFFVACAPRNDAVAIMATPADSMTQQVMASFVMAGLDPAIHVFLIELETWMPGTRPGMTTA